MIRLENITVTFGDKTVLHDFSFKFPEKGIVLITGASGSGKTTLTKIILGRLKADNGSVSSDNKKISVVFQEDRLIETLTALQNVELVSNRRDAIKRLEQMKLGDSLHKYPSELSGGMKRRVAIARALAFDGDVLLLDEAFAGIDDVLAKELADEICIEFKDRLVIVATHRPELFADADPIICSI